MPANTLPSLLAYNPHHTTALASLIQWESVTSCDSVRWHIRDVGGLGCGFVLLFSIFYILYSVYIYIYIYIYIGISRNRAITQDPHIWGQTNFGPAHTTELPGHKPLVVNIVVIGPFKEEEEGIDIASDVVKMDGEVDHPSLSEGGQGEEGCRRFRIVDMSPLTRSW